MRSGGASASIGANRSAMANLLIPLPDRDFDVTEVAVPWKVLTRAGHRVAFTTERGGSAPQADPRLLTGVTFGRPVAGRCLPLRQTLRRAHSAPGAPS